MKHISSPNKVQLKFNYAFLSLFVFTLIGFNSASYGQTVLPTNSSPTGAGVAPVGWTVVSGSTDISNKDFWAGFASSPWFAPVIVDPPNAHTVWVTGFFTEIVGTTITGLTPGIAYNMNFYKMESRSSSGGTPTVYDGTLEVTVGAEVFLFPFSGGIDNSWSAESFTFTAAATDVDMEFKYIDGIANGNFWNISFSDDVVDPDCDELFTSVSSTEICLGEEITLHAESETGSTITWDDGVIDSEAFIPSTAGVITYTATSAYDGDCIFTVEITVNALPVVTANVDDSEICLGESITLTGGGADSYVWDMGVTDGVAITPGSIGTFTYNVTGTNTTTTCVNTASVNVIVDACEDVIAAFTYDNNICVGDCIVFTDTSLGTIVSWLWDFGGGGEPATSTEQNPKICFNTAGIYDIQLTVTSSHDISSSVTNTITVNEVPDVAASNDTIIDLGGNANLIAYSSIINGVYAWSPDDFVDCPDCPITTTSPLDDSTKYIVTYTDINGCSAEDDIIVYVNFIEGIGVPTAFSPNNDGVNDILFVRGFGITSMNFVIYNRYGEVVFESSDQSIGWDGTFKERDENPGVFTWVLQYNLTSGKKGKQKGNTTLIR